MKSQKLEEIFVPGGVLAKVLAPEFEWRPQQAEMAQAVYRTLKEGGVLLAEAPTGVGKSLSYLVPGILWSLEARLPLVISTYTRTLQDQILDKEIPRVRRVLDRPFRVAVLKGRSNYLCRNRYQHYVEETRGTAECEAVTRALGSWPEFTDTGDLSEAPTLEARWASALGRIAGETRFCSTSRCTPESGCFFKLSRRRARDAHLLVINHSLLMVDLFGRGSTLPEWSAAVIDEGHHLPRVAAEPLTFSVSEVSLEAALRGLGGRGEPGATEGLRKALRGLPNQGARAEFLEHLRELESETARYSVLARNFWQELSAAPNFPPGMERLRYGASTAVRDPFPESGLDLCQALRGHLLIVAQRIDEAVRLWEGAKGDEPEPFELLESRRRWDQLSQEVGNLESLLNSTERRRVYWIEPRTGQGILLKTAPLEVGPELRERLFSTRGALIVTSATLSLHQRFHHLAEKLGLGEEDYEGLLLPSPFRLEDQVGAWVVTGIPDPNDATFHEELARGIVQLAKRLRRKMLVLFTSHDSLRRVEAAIRGPLSDTGIRLLAQGVDGGQSAIQAGFRLEGPAVLLGAASYWEGMDFPGEELEVLLMARLPFLVPTDPMVEATVERLEAEGMDPFRTFYLPEALLRFRQGFGRLIRRRGDRGLFVVVDPRLEERGYGVQYKRSVGVPFRISRGWDELVREAEAWFLAKAPE